MKRFFSAFAAALLAFAGTAVLVPTTAGAVDPPGTILVSVSGAAGSYAYGFCPTTTTFLGWGNTVCADGSPNFAAFMSQGTTVPLSVPAGSYNGVLATGLGAFGPAGPVTVVPGQTATCTLSMTAPPSCTGGAATGTVVVTVGEATGSYASGLCLSPGLPVTGSVTCSDGSSANVRFGLDPGSSTSYSLAPGSYTGGLALLSPLAGGTYGPVTVAAGTTLNCTFTMAAAPACTVAPSDDGDGVDEDPVADGNNDGTPDAQQANVTTLPAGAGGGNVTIDATGGASYPLAAVSTPPMPATPPPEGANLPVGLVSFTVHLPSGVTTADVAITTPPGTNPTSWFKLQNGAWYDFTSHATFTGDKVTLHLVDGGVGDADGTVNGVIVDPGGPGVNHAPTAATDTPSVLEDANVVVDVLANDSANDAGQTLTLQSVGSPAHGNASLSAGKVRYTPGADYSGPDAFTYQVCDSGVPVACSTGTVNVTVTPVNDAPRARVDGALTDEDTSVVVDVLGNDDTGPGEGPQHLSVTQVSSALLGNAAVVTTGPDAGKVRFTPTANQFGAGGFAYKVCDDGVPVKCDSSLVGVLVLPVNDAPTISATPDKSTKKNKSVSFIVTVDDVDNSSSSVDLLKSSSNTTLVPNGNISVSGSGATRTVTVSPASNKTGTTTITLTARDPFGATSGDQFVLTVTN